MKRAISSLLNVIVGILLIVGPWYLFKTCGTETKVMKCFWSCRAELALGLAFIALGLLALAVRDGGLLFPCLMSIVLSFAAVCVPAWIIGGCMKPSMACRAVTFPAIYFLNAVNVFVQSGILFCSRRGE